MNRAVYNHNEVIHVTTEQQIKMAVAFAGMTQGELARAVGMTPQNLWQRVRRDSLKPAEMQKIAQACGAKWVAQFVFDDGTRI